MSNNAWRHPELWASRRRAWALIYRRLRGRGGWWSSDQGDFWWASSPSPSPNPRSLPAESRRTSAPQPGPEPLQLSAEPEPEHAPVHKPKRLPELVAQQFTVDEPDKEAEHLARLDREADTVDGAEVAEGLLKFLDLDHRSRARLAPLLGDEGVGRSPAGGIGQRF